MGEDNSAEDINTTCMPSRLHRERKKNQTQQSESCQLDCKGFLPVVFESQMEISKLPRYDK
jgi:hypothetical protein